MSRVFKGGGAAVEPARWKRAGADPERGVREYRPRQVNAADAGLAPPEPEPAEEASAAASEPSPPDRPPEADPAPDLDAIRKEAFQEGFQAGEESGAKRAEQAAAARIDELGRVVDEIAGYKTALRAAAVRETVELAFAVARRVVRRELTLDPGMTLAMVRACLDEYPGVEVRRARVHPSSAALVEESLGERLEVVGDDAVAPGGAVLETEQGRLDARIDTQLEEIERGLTDR